MLVTETERQEIRAEALFWARKYGRVKEDFPIRRSIPWRPHLYCPESTLAVHLLLYPGIDQIHLEGFRLARVAMRKLRLVIAGPVRFIQTPSVLEDGYQVDAEWLVLEDKGGSVERTEYRDVLTVAYRLPLVLPTETYKKLAARGLSQTLSSKGQEKGRRLESFIAFLLSQVPGFEILSTNYNTATEEIDIVVRNRRVGGVFSTYPEPLILVECKNQLGRAGKNEYVTFVSKMRNRRQSVTVGFFVSVAGFTENFRLESLRDSRERLLVAKIGRDDIEKWIHMHGEAAAEYVERVVEESVLE